MTNYSKRLIWFSINKNTMLKKNLEDKLVKMSNLIGMWSARNLSLKGKIVVLKSVIMSIIVNIITIYIPNWFLESTDKLFFQFLWGKEKKVKSVAKQS